MAGKKKKGIEHLKSRYGIMFISPWVIGMLLFVITPIFQSIYFSFAKTSSTEEAVVTTLVRLKNYTEILFKNPDYTDNLIEAFSSLFISLPFIVIVSMVLALLLNGKYRFRIFFRGLYFLPVIIEAALSSTVSFGMIDFTEILDGLNLPQSIETYLSKALSNIFTMVWQSGIQTILIIAGLQSIPDLLYEVAKVEGATKWEEFWYITLPMLLRTMVLVILFTAIELVSSDTNLILAQGYGQFNSLEYGIGSAMLWFYYMIVAALLGVIFLIYQKVFIRKWG